MVSTPLEKLLANVEAEADTLSYLLFSPKSIARVVDRLTPEHFYRDQHVVIYRVMLDLYRQGRTCTVSNVWEELQRLDLHTTHHLRRGTLSEMKETRSLLEPLEEHVEKVLHKATFRRLYYTGYEIMGLAQREEPDAVAQAERLVYEIAVGTDTAPVTSLADALDAYIADLEQQVLDRAAGKARGIPTGFTDLDRLIGGVHPGKVYTIGALTGGGKSAFALNVAMNIVQHSRHALFFTLEMPTRELMRRIVGMETCIDQSLLRDADLDEVQLRAIKARAQGLRRCKLDIDDSATALEKIKSKIRQVHRRDPLNVVFLDYLQLMDASEGGRGRQETRAEEVAAMSKAMKRLAQELNISIVLLAQLNRAVEHRRRKEPVLADINESGGIARDSDVVLFLYQSEEETNQVVLKVAKNRDGDKGEIVLVFIPRITKFQDLTAPGDDADEQEYPA